MIDHEDGAPRKKTKDMPTKAQRRERTEACRGLMAMSYTNGMIKKAVSRKFKISPRSVEPYLRRARVLMLKEIDKTPDEMRSQSYETYRKIISNPDAAHKDIVAAQKQMDKLFGLNGPIKIAQTDTEGNDISTLAEARDEIHSVVSAISKRIGGRPTPSSNGHHSGEIGRPGDN